ncbi:MAG TPA: hypothetical protein VGM05_05275 [Planctomycetaceae bacterium]|jgi:hypothetical protein
MGAVDSQATDVSDQPAVRDAARNLFLAEARCDAVERSAEYQLASRARKLFETLIPPSGRFGNLHRALRKSLEIWLNEGLGMLWARCLSKVSCEAKRVLRLAADEGDRAAASMKREALVHSVLSLRYESELPLTVVGQAVKSIRPASEISHLVGTFCQSCRHFEDSECSRLPLGGSRSEQPGLFRILADRSCHCPAGAWDARESRPITRLNLVYHVTPLRHPDNVWQWNVRELLKRINLFNGRRIITVVTSNSGRTMDSPEAVAAAFSGHDVEFRFAPNDPKLREGRHFIPALREIASINPSEAVFYAHGKGVSHLDQRIVRPWTAAMYHHNLDRIEEVRDLLSRWPCVGIAKRRGDFVRLSYGQPRKPGSLRRRTWNDWHYSGTFWWARHDRLFSRPDWDQIPQHAFAVEGYLANFFRPEEAVCLAYEDIPDPYNAAIWQDAA